MDLSAYSDQATYKEFSPKTVPIPTGRLIELWALNQSLTVILQ